MHDWRLLTVSATAWIPSNATMHSGFLLGIHTYMIKQYSWHDCIFFATKYISKDIMKATTRDTRTTDTTNSEWEGHYCYATWISLGNTCLLDERHSNTIPRLEVFATGTAINEGLSSRLNDPKRIRVSLQMQCLPLPLNAIQTQLDMPQIILWYRLAKYEKNTQPVHEETLLQDMLEDALSNAYCFQYTWHDHILTCWRWFRHIKSNAKYNHANPFMMIRY